MILFQNSLIKLDYDPATDILSVDMPHITYDLDADFARALDIIVENVRNYDVKYLLIDASKSVIDLESGRYTELVTKFSYDLRATRLQKGARVVSANKMREEIVQEVIDDVHQTLIYQSFTDTNVALDWLKNK